MGTYRTFREIPLWNEAVDFAAEIYIFCERGALRTDYKMKDQLRAAAASISNNIAEGFEYDSTKSFIQFLTYSKGSAAEVFNQLTILHKAEMLLGEDYLLYSEKALALNRKIGGLINYLRKKQLANEPMS
jgi:four helix bundle protein